LATDGYLPQIDAKMQLRTLLAFLNRNKFFLFGLDMVSFIIGFCVYWIVAISTDASENAHHILPKLPAETIFVGAYPRKN
jgi:hypothetical protein